MLCLHVVWEDLAEILLSQLDLTVQEKEWAQSLSQPVLRTQKASA